LVFLTILMLFAISPPLIRDFLSDFISIAGIWKLERSDLIGIKGFWWWINW